MTHYLSFRNFLSERLLLFYFLLLEEKKKKKKYYLYVIETIFRILFRMFCTLNVVIEDQNHRLKQKRIYAMQCIGCRGQGTKVWNLKSKKKKKKTTKPQGFFCVSICLSTSAVKSVLFTLLCFLSGIWV